MPISHISVATMIAMARLVPIVLTQGCQPLRIKPNGSRCRRTKR